MSEEIFVFGSNLAGRHGKGAALYARKHYGAVLGVGRGLTGRSYAIPTKDASLHTLPLDSVRMYVNEFITYARNSNHMQFMLTPIGCGLAGYTADQIAPMFRNAPPNVFLPNEFKKVLGYV